MRFKNYIERESISEFDINKFVSDWKTKIKSQFGADFDLTKHFLKDRLNDTRNKPPILIEEINWLLESWFKKNKTLFKKDVEDVKNNIAKARGIAAKTIRREYPNNLEFTISGKIKDRNILNVSFALKQKDKQKGTAVLKPITIIRTPNKKQTRGEYFWVDSVYEIKGTN